MIHGHEVREKKRLAVLCDFDGTITRTDTLAYVLRKFAVGDWRRFDEQYEKGEISLRECLRSQGRLVRTPEMVLVAEMERVAEFRPNFDKLVLYCRYNRVTLIAVSAGLDFIIRDLLRMKGWNNMVKLSAAKAVCTPEGIKFTFPRLHDRTSLSVKEDLVKYYKAKGWRVAYIGDGIWDIHALKEADYRFAVKDSKLAELCRRQGIPAREVSDFLEMVTAIQYDL